MTEHIEINGKKVPRFFYGTAWKEAKTADLVHLALSTGFRAIDTANQRKHYYEESVGQGIARFYGESSVQRPDLFIQTKFTYARGQDHRKPYDESAPFSQQVKDSFASSLEHLNTDFIDSYVLHGPFDPTKIGDEDLETWATMESLVDEGKVKFLGVSNISPQQLVELSQKVRIKPTFVQNRCFARMAWDRAVREICKKEGIIYQGFSLLTANSLELNQQDVAAIAKKYNKTIPQVVFRFCLQLGMICLTGTTDQEHMQQDLNVFDFELTEDEVLQLENIAL